MPTNNDGSEFSIDPSESLTGEVITPRIIKVDQIPFFNNDYQEGLETIATILREMREKKELPDNCHICLSLNRKDSRRMNLPKGSTLIVEIGDEKILIIPD